MIISNSTEVFRFQTFFYFLSTVSYIWHLFQDLLRNAIVLRPSVLDMESVVNVLHITEMRNRIFPFVLGPLYHSDYFQNKID